VPHERSAAFAPGRVNLIGEHTDYNEGLALPFAIVEGVHVQAQALPADTRRVRAYARDLDERDEFDLDAPAPAEGWRAFVRGTAAELAADGFQLAPAQLEIDGDVPRGAGLSSSAALEVALCLALAELGADGPPGAWFGDADRLRLARVCSRVESDWAGARTGLLDQLASLCGRPGHVLLIDFRTLAVEPVELVLDGWRLVVVDSGERHSHAASGYNDRRAECARASELLGVSSLREADERAARELPEPLRRRALHVIGENRRVLAAAAALRNRDLDGLALLFNSSHASLRDDYEISTDAVERTVAALLRAGAAGARLTGGGFGGSVLALFAPGVTPPTDAHEVWPASGACLLEV
jgi:galactokinase